MATNNPLLPVPVEMLLGAAGVALTSWFFLRQLRTRPHPLRTILEFEWLAFPEGYCHQHPSAPLRPNMRTLILTLASTCGRCQWRESTPEVRSHFEEGCMLGVSNTINSLACASGFLETSLRV